MSADLFWSHGHLGWPLFAILAYTCALFLFADAGWRLLVVSTRRLAGVLGVIWLLGVAGIWLAWL